MLFKSSLLTLEKTGNVFVLTMAGDVNKANVFNKELVSDFHSALDIVESTTGAASLVITGRGNKFFSAGFDLSLQNKGMEYFIAAVESFFPMVGRILTFQVPTIAAINGHCFGAGAFLAIATDYTIMASDEGKFCFPEAAIGMNFSPAFVDLLKAKLPAHAIKSLVLQGRRLSAEEALDINAINMIVPRAELRIASLQYGEEVSKAGATRDIQKRVKLDFYQDCFDHLNNATIMGRRDQVSAKL